MQPIISFYEYFTITQVPKYSFVKDSIAKQTKYIRNKFRTNKRHFSQIYESTRAPMQLQFRTRNFSMQREIKKTLLLSIFYNNAFTIPKQNFSMKNTKFQNTPNVYVCIV